MARYDDDVNSRRAAPCQFRPVHLFLQPRAGQEKGRKSPEALSAHRCPERSSYLEFLFFIAGEIADVNNLTFTTHL